MNQILKNMKLIYKKAKKVSEKDMKDGIKNEAKKLFCFFVKLNLANQS